ncbi:hypothetical protein HDV01_000639 [Terramyces sp. JEL0728]|nr:hypothetical protein HDV01_000639 [Terramyces sp. JEL0728]
MNEQLDFLLESAYKMLSQSPEISRHLIVKFIQVSSENNIPISTTLSRNYCQKCGSIYMPGINTILKIRNKGPNNKQLPGPSAVLSKKTDPVSWYMSYRCLYCRKETLFPVCNESHLKSINSRNKETKADHLNIDPKIDPKPAKSQPKIKNEPQTKSNNPKIKNQKISKKKDLAKLLKKPEKEKFNLTDFLSGL